LSIVGVVCTLPVGWEAEAEIPAKFNDTPKAILSGLHRTPNRNSEFDLGTRG
jgi:hypothetical protein